jgi:stress response protein SCP2
MIPSPPETFLSVGIGGGGRFRSVIELSPGQVIPVTAADGSPLPRLRMGVGWDKSRTAGAIGTGRPDIDLDASAVQFAGGRLFDLAFYNNLRTRDGSVVHEGDNTTGSGAGDDEVISVDLTKVYEQVDTIFFLVSSYQGHSLEWIANAYCRLLDDHDAELARFTLTLGVSETGLVMAKLVRSGEGWRLHAIGAGVPIKVPSDAVAKLGPFL